MNLNVNLNQLSINDTVSLVCLTTNLTKVMSHFIKLSNLPKCFGSYIPKPSVTTNNDVIITHDVITHDPAEEYSRGIYMYNIKDNTITSMTEFTEWKLMFHAQCLDTKNNKLYVFGAVEQDETILCNVETNVLKRTLTELELISNFKAQSLYIEKTHQILICTHQSHIYTINDDTLKTYTMHYDHNSEMNLFAIPIKIGNEFKILGGSHHFILTTMDASKVQDLNKVKWNECTLKMPNTVETINCFDAIALDYIAIIFYFDPNEVTYCNEIWCIDFLHLASFKSSQIVPFEGINCYTIFYAIKLNNDCDVHLIEFNIGQHYKIDIDKLIPQQLHKKYSKHYNKLVFGYCKNNSFHVPIYLIKLIFNYFPYFL